MTIRPEDKLCRPLGEADAFKLRRIRLLSGGLATEGQTLQAARQSHLLRAMVYHQAKGQVLQAAWESHLLRDLVEIAAATKTPQ